MQKMLKKKKKKSIFFFLNCHFNWISIICISFYWQQLPSRDKLKCIQIFVSFFVLNLVFFLMRLSYTQFSNTLFSCIPIMNNILLLLSVPKCNIWDVIVLNKRITVFTSVHVLWKLYLKNKICVLK